MTYGELEYDNVELRRDNEELKHENEELKCLLSQQETLTHLAISEGEKELGIKLHQIGRALYADYRDLQDALEMEMTEDLALNLRDSLENVFSELKRLGVVFPKSL